MTLFVLRVERPAEIVPVEQTSRRIRLAACRPADGGRKRRTAAA